VTRDGTYKREGLAQEMFRKMLCKAVLCSYGTSPRTCFPTREFAALFPELIERWRAYAEVAWGKQATGDTHEVMRRAEAADDQ